MKNLKTLTLITMLALSAPALAHDEGHGPKLTDTGNYGGVVTAVVESKDAGKGAKAPLHYKAELARSEDGTVRVYLYDSSMKALPADSLPKSAKGNVISLKKGKYVAAAFDLTLQGNALVGSAPKPNKVPFSIDLKFTIKDKELLAAFDNLD